MHWADVLPNIMSSVPHAFRVMFSNRRSLPSLPGVHYILLMEVSILSTNRAFHVFCRLAKKKNGFALPLLRRRLHDCGLEDLIVSVLPQPALVSSSSVVHSVLLMEGSSLFKHRALDFFNDLCTRKESMRGHRFLWYFMAAALTM